MQEVKNFKIHLERLGYSKTSIYMLPNCLKEFLEFIRQRNGQTAKPILEIETKDITNYHEYLKERPNKNKAGGLSESYINHHIYSLKLFFGWQQEKGVITENPISSLEFKAPTSQPREILTAHEIKELYAACETLKERAVLSLFYGCGIRRSEGEQLNLKDIHFRTNLLYVREGKGNKRRAVPLSPQVKKDLWNYATKERETRENEAAFMTNKIQKRATGSSYNKILKSILEKTGIKKEITLHCLRHSIATHLLESGLSVENVRDFLGHKHLESTQIYTRVKSKQIWNLQDLSRPFGNI
jgi:integrase/recombinase XerD